MSLANEDVTVTDADRDEAVRLLRDAAADKLIQSTEPRKQPEMVDRIAAALADAREDCGHHSWAGLLALLDEHWPADIFPTREDDPARDSGPRIVSLIRHVADARAEAEVLTRRAKTAEAALSTARRGWDTARAEADQLRDAMRALAEEWDAQHADWCCQKGCPSFDGTHPGDVEFTTEGGIQQIGPDFPCPGECTCFVGLFRDRVRDLADGGRR